MTLDELKNEWQQPSTRKDEVEIQKVVAKKTSSVFSRIKLRAVIESTALLLVLLVFFTGLDAHLNATWVNISFALATLTGIANNVILYRRTIVNAGGTDLATSLRRVNDQLWWQIRMSAAFSALLFFGVFAFLLLRIPMTDQKLILILLVLPASIGIRTWFEVRQLRRDLSLVQHSLAELRE